jgi:hypothetical protein
LRPAARLDQFQNRLHRCKPARVAVQAAAAADQAGLRAQDRPADDLELVIAQRRAGLGDIGDHIGVAQAGGRLCGALRIDQPKEIDAIGVAEAADQRGILRGDP